MKIIRSRKFRDLVLISLISVASLAIFHISPRVSMAEQMQGSFEYLLVTIFAAILIIFTNSPSVQYFRKPARSLASFVALAIAFLVSVFYFSYGWGNASSTEAKICGIGALILIGLGEELFARGFILGSLLIHGKKFAILSSSAIFGLMHLNVYIHGPWDPEWIIDHISSTFAFGFFAAALMMATRSIWVPILVHASVDWNVYFNKKHLDTFGGSDSGDQVGLIKHIGEFLMSISFAILPFTCMGLLIFWVMRGPKLRRTRKLAMRIAIRFKLVEL